MSDYIVQLDLFGNKVRCETNGLLISLNDLFNAGNTWRLSRNMAALQLASFINAVGTVKYLEAASEAWGVDKSTLLFKTGKGKYTRTMCHITIGILAAEMISPEFHVRIHKELIEGKLLEFREYGGTEFNKLNVYIDQYLPGREDKSSNKGVYIQVARLLKARILKDSELKDSNWNKVTAIETYRRYEIEHDLCQFLKMNLVKDFDHLKELIKNI